MNLLRSIPLISLVWIVGCSSPKPCELPLVKQDVEPQSVSSVLYCLPRTTETTSVRAQVLIDSSGSMRGFEVSGGRIDTWTPSESTRPKRDFESEASTVGRMDEWTLLGISQAQGAPFRLASLRRCYFDQRRGIHSCVSGNALRPVYRTSGSTNLHEAIETAFGYDLTVIITDGVEASDFRFGHARTTRRAFARS